MFRQFTAIVFFVTTSVAIAQTPAPKATPAPATKAAAATPAPAAPVNEMTPPTVAPVATPAKEEPKSAEQQAYEEFYDRVRFQIGVGINSGSTLVFSDVKATGAINGTDGEYEAETESGAGTLSFGMAWARTHHWGVDARLTFEGAREIEKDKFKMNGTTTNNTYTDKAKFRVTTLEANALYRWNKFYLPFGLNVSAVKLDQPSTATTDLDVKGSVGMQAGVGWYFTRHFNLDTKLKLIGMTAKGDDGTTKYDFGTGFLGGLTVQANYVF